MRRLSVCHLLCCQRAAAARLIANLHGGTLLLESRPDIGTSIRVSLSLAPHDLDPFMQPRIQQDSTMIDILTGLADCLPAELYSDKFMD